jgi:hypothetical protein
VLLGYYVWENKRRDARKEAVVDLSYDASEVTARSGLTNKENNSFRYVY